MQPSTTTTAGLSELGENGAGASDWAIVLVTTVLVVVTIYYAIQNRRMVDEMKSARLDALERDRRREASRFSVWVESLEFYSEREGRYVLRAKNSGSGPIHRLRVSISSPAGEELGVPWSVAVLAPDVDLQSNSTSFLNRSGYLTVGDLQLSVSFVDGSGATWTRRPDGMLVEDKVAKRA